MTIQFNLSQMLTFKYGAVAEAVEILIEQLSRTLSRDFCGGEWVGVELENGGFYAIPAIDCVLFALAQITILKTTFQTKQKISEVFYQQMLLG